MSILPGVVQAAGNLQSQMVNSGLNVLNNVLEKKYNKKIYEQQKADNLTQWNLQNDYNSPTSQMARLREAGLNPNLVYGNGATSQAQPVPMATQQSAGRQQAPPLDFGGVVKGGLESYVNLESGRAQIDNLKAQNNVLVQEAALKAAQTADTNIRASRSKFDLGLATDLRNNSLDITKANLAKINQEMDIGYQANDRANTATQISLDANDRAKIMQQETITNMKKVGQNLVLDRIIKQQQLDQGDQDLIAKEYNNAILRFDAEMAKHGITSNSAKYATSLVQFLSNFAKNYTTGKRR